MFCMLGLTESIYSSEIWQVETRSIMYVSLAACSVKGVKFQRVSVWIWLVRSLALQSAWRKP